MKNPFKSSLETYTIPLKFTNSKHLICQLFLNGVEGNFLIDTGASNSCLDNTLTTKFSVIQEGDELPLTSAGNEKLNAMGSQKSSLGIASKALASIPFMLIDMETINAALVEQGDEKIDGIIGADFLHKKKASIDYDQSCLVLKESSWF
ncbi:retroviral-like aspartic protease family protein [Flavobacteriaceae bacterium]|jgi:predicted aspartyl protease|nr:retroviral-like aspartic protease family protein [Flavobacteriaceae bacterium]MDB9885914.1 retroviral-like aspartic protease family protein [Flavobacteriaceae bacterium]MDB9941658.1 retroviral-like aspartic protease family protein [Flavobacteriaceae bacterium]MDC0014308.1 retroviral-like aspartic protease family protein [Flavobacteriaceae bacterium]MDC1402753.1 retroviral-like aspartic protease family protein [Flavobacteriaceae bacterium]